MSNTDHSTPQNSPAYLVEFIKRRREERSFTLKTIVECACAGGHPISVGYLSVIESGSVTNPASAKLKALACGLGVSEKEIFEVMQGIAFDESEGFTKANWRDARRKSKHYRVRIG